MPDAQRQSYGQPNTRQQHNRPVEELTPSLGTNIAHARARTEPRPRNGRANARGQRRLKYRFPARPQGIVWGCGNTEW
eukprot:11156058-Lingulodinium_polyedra.AAC.1